MSTSAITLEWYQPVLSEVEQSTLLGFLRPPSDQADGT